MVRDGRGKKVAKRKWKKKIVIVQTAITEKGKLFTTSFFCGKKLLGGIWTRDFPTSYNANPLPTILTWVPIVFATNTCIYIKQSRGGGDGMKKTSKDGFLVVSSYMMDIYFLSNYKISSKLYSKNPNSNCQATSTQATYTSSPDSTPHFAGSH